MTGGQHFQVNLRGIVDLFSQHLYTSPRVFARELVQNATDAIAARRALTAADPGADGAVTAGAGEIRIEPLPDGGVRVSDDGIGLTESEVHTFLASVGSTTKRDELGFARQDFLGQFGIGLLSCFMVSDLIEVVSRSAKGGPAVRWVGRADGTYHTEVDDAARAAIGTTVTLRPRPDSAHWLAPEQLSELVHHYAHLLPVPITLATEDGPVALTDPAPAWAIERSDPNHRRQQLLDYAEELFGVRPMDLLDLRVPEAGLTGVGFILPSPSTAGQRGGHRVYLKRMLLTEDADRLLPEWAFFVRCVVDTSLLRPTASREALYEDDLLSAVRQSLGEQIQQWLRELSVHHPARLAEFLRVHHLGVKALARHDDEMLRLVDAWLPYETSRGPMPLRDFRQGASTIVYTETVDEFRGLATIASAAGAAIVNGGYAYDTEILQRLPRLDPSLRVRRLDPSELAATLEPLPEPQLAALAGFLDTARHVLAELGCVPQVRQFHPINVPALYVVSQAAREQDLRQRNQADADDLWSSIFAGFGEPETDDRPELVFNWRHPLIRRIATEPPGPTLRHAVEALYGQALLAGHHPLRAVDGAALNRSFLGLLERAFASD
ncbi:HSP90 family protein [Natronosporangium hydrolyticum]|uniref:HSP90 family protein n=1 Tax=Natronosporangium hydrolyticum TaxID=2811111 RepID=A0A895YFV0_9ACTN|nr:HSP90 family protein [Natronosporangium hydrolyticum]QSB16744.1 HSP90 family protein [Natronosporangium hydrolyticum]